MSRVGGREGDSFISCDVQRKQIASYCDAFGLKIAAWHEELDVSGGTTNRKLLNQALTRIENGASGGIIVAKLDRFARNVREGLASIQRITDAGGRFICVDQNFDTSTAQGRFFLTLMLAFAELERENRRRDWKIAGEEAIARGVYIAARPPSGYKKQNDGVLAPDPHVAPLIAEVFFMRANGAGWAECHRFLLANDLRITRQGIKAMVANPAYKGWARWGKIVNAHAHEPIVTDAEWDIAQATRTTGHLPPAEAKSKDCLLLGIARCANCGYAMHVHGKTGQPLSYACRKLHGAMTCPRPASLRTSLADAHVESALIQAFSPGGYLTEALEDVEAVTELASQAQDAEHELTLYLANTKLLAVGQDAFNRGAHERHAAVELAQLSLTAAKSRSTLADTLPPGNLLDAWPTLPNAAKRRILAAVIDRVAIGPAEKRGQRSGHERRIQIVLTGNVILEPTETRNEQPLV